ncbi:sensor histidine kinase [Roseateles cellulosilyticus]|uniref:histidine kinase n=1 Tax=Pelomonas cellulosilytica TaxID=2906762 RepID=A0ABS8XT22_9BURK|nr:ATP-binding protein [Pelomonas sp. P8]MCE4553814.1 ATP-binding protein [Pelomonas sp. P8]
MTVIDRPPPPPPGRHSPEAWLARQPLIPLAVGLALAYTVAAMLSLQLSRQPGSVASIWYANALAVAALAHRHCRDWPALLGAVTLAIIGANALWGDPLLPAMTFIPANLAEVSLAAAALRHAGLQRSGVVSAATLGKALLLAAVAAPLAGATVATLSVGPLIGQGLTGLWLPWLEGAAIGALSTLPLALLLAGEGPAPLRQLAGQVLAWALLCAAIGAALLAAGFLPYPMVYATLPLLTAAVMLPLAGTYVLTLAVSITLAAALGSGLLPTPPLSAAWQQVFIYIAIAAALLPGQLLAATLRELRRSQRHLAQRTDALKRANEGLEQFVHFSAHDLREPLNTIAGFGSLLRDEAPALDATARQHLDLMLRGTERMRTLLDDMLAYARLQQHEAPTMARVDLDQALQAARDGLAQQIANSGARITTAPLGHVTGHSAMLQVMLQNLLSNALKFVEAGKAPEVEFSAFDDGPDRVLQVRDHGIGISAEGAARLFKPFQRLHTRRRYEGSGLGLALVRRIVDVHGGSISVAPAEGGGSCFTVRLPRGPGLEATA